MAYITNADIEQRVGSAAFTQLADDDGDGLADAGVVDEVRLAAEGELDSFLARRYRTPIFPAEFPELAGLLAAIALDLAEYRLRLRRPPLPADVVQRHRLTLKWLERIAAGVIALPSAAPLPSAVAGGTVAAVRGEARMLSREEMADV